MIGLARLLLAGHGVGCLDADQDRQLLAGAGNQGWPERLDEDLGGVVVGHRVSCSAGAIAGG